LNFINVTVRAVQDRIVLHRQPPAQGGRFGGAFLLLGRQQVEVTGNAGVVIELADADHFHPIVGFHNHSGDPGVDGHAVHDDVLNSKFIFELPSPATDGR
jgi:hypothetical protein